MACVGNTSLAKELPQNVMSCFSQCKEQLRQREVAAQTDYKVDYGVAHSCQNEIQTHSCIPPSTYKQEFGLSYVILCLEGAIHKQGIVAFFEWEALSFYRNAWKFGSF